MERVLDVGGIFFKAKDPAKLKAWYRDHLGLPTDEQGETTFPTPGDHPHRDETPAERLVHLLERQGLEGPLGTTRLHAPGAAADHRGGDRASTPRMRGVALDAGALIGIERR